VLLTGMETDLRLVKKARRAAIGTSAAGIIVPFACGFALGEGTAPPLYIYAARAGDAGASAS
jgi:Kef-type K+ transport system membrane component KefB